MLYRALGDAGSMNLPLSDTSAEQAILQEMADARYNHTLCPLDSCHALLTLPGLVLADSLPTFNS